MLPLKTVLIQTGKKVMAINVTDFDPDKHTRYVQEDGAKSAEDDKAAEVKGKAEAKDKDASAVKSKEEAKAKNDKKAPAARRGNARKA